MSEENETACSILGDEQVSVVDYLRVRRGIVPVRQRRSIVYTELSGEWRSQQGCTVKQKGRGKENAHIRQFLQEAQVQISLVAAAQSIVKGCSEGRA